MSYPKNSVSPPKLFATVVKAADGTGITSGVAAKYSTGAGSQAAGSGTCQYEGNGQWSYAPTQAETNVDGFGVQFYHTDAVGSGPTVNVVTSASVVQTGDAYARLGAPVGASVSADIAALPTVAQINAEVVDVLRTDTIPDSYAADGAQPTIAQAVLAIQQYLFERSVSGTTVTVKKPDGSATAMTFTLNDGTNPTSQTRAT